MGPEVLRRACDQNLTLAFAALIPHVGFPSGEMRSFGSVVAVATGLSVGFYNPVMVTAPESSAGDIAAGVEWVESLGLATCVQVRADLRDRFDEAVRELGLEPDTWTDPGMALHPIPDPPPPPPGLRIERTGPDTFEDWHTALSSGSNFRRAFPRTVLGDPAFRLVTGYAEDEPVTAGSAIITGEVVGVYAVGTAERARRRGFGRAITWAAVQAGMEAGCRIAVLQSSEMAVGVYEGMGFVEVCRYVEYQRPQARADSEDA
jgi:GNAT superfamily N-acetyltransferase